MKLRPGNTFSSEGASQQMEEITSGLTFKDEKYYRADSAFCNEEVMKAALRLGYKFTITAHENMGWWKDKEQITNWTPWVYTKEDYEQAEKRKKLLPECEVGHYLYQPR